MPKSLLRHCIQKIATGPEYSTDLSFDEARDAALAILDGQVDDVQAAIFFIALRMKRETDDENAGVLAALRQRCQQRSAEVEQLVDIADPYDGHARGLSLVAFLPALLAACGLPALGHGLESVGPKHGATQRQVLRAAGAAVDLSPQGAADQLADSKAGWAYLDQRYSCPALHTLLPLRESMVKRPVLTTLESLLGPIRARGRTHLYTGYVHKAYPEKYAKLACAAEFDSALIVRGVEGGVIPSLQQPAKYFAWVAGEALLEQRCEPSALGIEQSSRAAPLPADLAGRDARPDDFQLRAAQAAADAGLTALHGGAGPARDALVYAAALALSHCKLVADLAAGAAQARAALDSGAALTHFRAGAGR